MSHATPPHLWKAARAIFNELRRWFGAPIDIAQKGILERREYDLISRFLRGVEALLRTLLFIEAVEFCAAGDAPAPSPRTARPYKPRQRPASARVCFRVLDPKRTKRRRRGSALLEPLWTPTRYYEANPLALRAEAVLRVLNDPAPYVRRLARKLKADATVASRIEANGNIDPNVMAVQLWIDMREAFAVATARLADTS